MANNNKGVPVLNAPFSKEQEEAMKRIQLAQMNANKLPTDWSQNVPTQNNPKQSTPVQSTPTQPINNVPKNNYTQNDAVGVGIKEPTRLTGFDRTNAINKYGSYENFGKYAPIQATLSSILSAPVVAAEGLIGTLVNGMNATSKKEIPEIERKQLEIQRQMREGAKSNINSNVGKGAYDIATGIGDMLTNTALAGGVGGGTALAGTLMGGQRANQVYQDAIDRGIDRNKATALATASGVAEGFFNTKGLDAIKSGITGNLLQKAIKGGAIEGAENILQTATEDIADALINGTDSELNAIKQNYLAQGMSEEEANKQTTIDVLKQYGMDFTTGAGFGAIMGTGREALGELPRLLKNTDNTRVDADNLNPLDMVADNERIVADAIARQNEAVDNINKLNEQLPEQTRSYRDLLSDNPYYDSDDFKAFSQERNSIIETRNKITDEIRDIDKQLDNYLEPNGLDKNTARALNLYSEEAQPLLARREALQQESNSLNDRFKELSDSLDNLRDNARANELANYSFDNNFRPLSQTEYDGFDINKGTNGEVQAALDSGKATLVEMTPEEYLRRVTYDIFNTSTMDSAIRGVESPDNIAKYAEAMRNGEKFPILNLTYDSKYGRGQEGRTRALAAYEAGIDKIPVAILGEPSENLNNRSLLDRINNARTQTDGADIDDLIENMDIEELFDDSEFVDDILADISAENFVDNTNGQLYNQGKGDNVYEQTSRTNDGTRSEGLLLEVRSDGSLGSTRLADGIRGRKYLPPNRISVANELKANEDIYDNSVIDIFKRNNVEVQNFKNSSINDELFVKALSTAKANNPNGASVDPHSVDDIRGIVRNGGSTFLTLDGTAGGAVEGDGNLTAVFKDSKNNDTPRMASQIALSGVKNGANKCDCFGIFLVNSYSKSGFEPVARMQYGYGINEAMDKQVREQLSSGIISKEPDVYVLKLRDGYDFERIVEEYNTAKRYSQAELDSLPLFVDYNKMMAYRDSLIKQPNQGAFFDAKNTNSAYDDADWARFDNATEADATDLYRLEQPNNAQMSNSAQELPMPPKAQPTNNQPNLTQQLNPFESDVRERGYAESIRNKSDMPEDIKKEFVDKPEMYKQLHNADTKAKADAILQNNDINGATNEFHNLLVDKDPSAIPLGYDLAKMYIDKGDNESAVIIIRNMSETLTESGQFSQAAAITLMHNDPMTALRYMQKQIDSMNEQGAKRYSNWKDFKLTDEEVKRFSDLDPGDAEGIKNAYDEISKRIGKEYPVTLWEKLNEGAKLSMLLNTRTHIRNAGANLALQGTRSLSDRISALGQNAAKLFNPDVEVTQSITGGTKAQKDIAGQVFDKEFKSLLDNSDKWDNLQNGVRQNKQVFKGNTIVDKGLYRVGGVVDTLTGGKLGQLVEKNGGELSGSVLEDLRKFDYYLLSAVEDDPFVKNNFVNRLASYMKAQGISNIDDIPPEAKSIAWQEALKATFKDDNKMTALMSGIKGNLGKFGDILLPFTKTPANLAMRGIDYSPVGIYNAMSKYYKTPITDRNIGVLWDNLSKGIVGTAGIALGFLLAKNGVITGKLDGNKRRTNFEKNNQGKQDYSFRINLGENDKYYSYDWAQPFATPLVLGASMYDAVKNSEDEDATAIQRYLQGAKNGVLGATDAWFNASPLQSIKDLLAGSENGSTSESIGERVANTVIDFPQRFIPAQEGALARANDPVMRETYDNTSKLNTWLNQGQSKIIGASEQLPAKYDQWGNERRRSSSKGEALFAQLINPGQLKEGYTTPIDDEIIRLDKDKAYPRVAGWSIDGRKLNNKEHSDYQKAMGQKSYELANEFILNSKDYETFDDDTKAEIIDQLYATADAIGKRDALGIEISESSDYKKLVDTYEKGGAQALVKTLVEKKQRSILSNEYGLDFSSDKVSRVYEVKGEEGIKVYKDLKSRATTPKGTVTIESAVPTLERSNMSKKDKGFYLAQLVDVSANKAKEFRKKGDYESLYDYYSLKQLSSSYDGKPGFSKKTDLIPYLEKNGYSDSQIKEISSWYK